MVRTRFGGYRGLFTIAGGKRIQPAFDWSDEFPAGVTLPQNNQIVIYEMPVKWMASDVNENPLVEVGTLDKVIFEHLKDLAAMGINCIELLPIEDSPQTLNWGYGTRFFFAPDYDIARPVDTKFFVKACHQLGIRVLLDVVMNFYAPECPLQQLAQSWFNDKSGEGRNPFGQELFLFNTPSYGNYYAAREFLYEMAQFWVSEYRIDGFRIDDFADISNYDFVRQFRTLAMQSNAALSPPRPFLVIAEDSERRFAITRDDPGNPDGSQVVDAIWNFGYRDEIRRLLTDEIDTVEGQPSRTQRVEHLISNMGMWNAFDNQFDAGFADMTCSVPYITSHDVADGPRLMNVLLGPMLAAVGLGNDIDSVKAAVDGADAFDNPTWQDNVQTASMRVFGGFAILMTTVGMPMFLAGEEFADVHDMSWTDVNPKQEDPVQWGRAKFKANSALMANVAKLIKLRTSCPALQRDEVSFFYFHPQFDDDNAARVFAYCRTNGQPLGSPGQVIVVANMGPQSYPVYGIPNWPWIGSTLTETGYPAQLPTFDSPSGQLLLALNAFAVRIFQT